MSEQSSTIISKVWGMCGPPRTPAGGSGGFFLAAQAFLTDAKNA